MLCACWDVCFVLFSIKTKLMFFLFLHKNICCVLSLEALIETLLIEVVLMSTHNLCFRHRNKKIFFRHKNKKISFLEQV